MTKKSDTASYISNNNKEIYDRLSDKVIGHDSAKKTLINILNRSKFRHYQKHILGKKDNLVKLANCLLIGDSGTGKTFLVESLSSIMEFPYIKIDATDLTLTSADGLKPDDIIKMINKKADKLCKDNPEIYFSVDHVLTQFVVFVDEIDKLGLGMGNNSWAQRVQANYLALFENKTSLTDLTFIFAGAFSNWDKHNKNKTTMGFCEPVKSHQRLSEIASHQEIIKYGLMPELVGRMHSIVMLDKLTEDSYRHILITKTLPEARETLEVYGIKKFNLTEQQISSIITDTIKSKLGVRFLESSVSRLIKEIEFNPKKYKAFKA